MRHDFVGKSDNGFFDKMKRFAAIRADIKNTATARFMLDKFAFAGRTKSDRHAVHHNCDKIRNPQKPRS